MQVFYCSICNRLPFYSRQSFRVCNLLALSLLVFGTPALAQTSQPPHLSSSTVLTPTASGGLTPDSLVQSEAALFAAQSQFDNIKLRIAALRAKGRTSGFGMNQGPGSNVASLGSMLQNSLAASESKPETGTDFSRWGFFATANYGEGNSDSGLVSPGTNFNLAGFTAGLDYRASDKWVVGGAIGFNRQNTDLTLGEGRSDFHQWSLSAYSTYFTQDSWYADTVVSYGHNSFDMRRVIGSQVLSGNPGGDNFSVTGSFGRDFNSGAWGFGPYVRLQYNRFKFDTFTEQIVGVGPVVPQVITTRNLDLLSGLIGAKLTYAHSTSWGVLIPHVDIEWQHEFRGAPTVVETNFVGGLLNAVIVGDPVDSNFFKLGAGMSFILANGRSGFIYYERLEGLQRISKYNLSLGLRIEF